MQKEQQLNDSILVTNYINGNERSLEILIKRHKNRIFGHIYSKVLDRDVANDIFQDTFIKVINTLKARKYNEEGKFLPWVLRIAHNLSIDHFRKKKRVPTFNTNEDFDIFSFIGDSSLNAENQLIKNQIHFDVQKIVNELPEEQKEVLNMRIYRDMSYKEISESTGTSINTSLGRMRYALMNLRKIINTNNIVLTK
jgi:RNA polymerase sigma-70 factor (ECF subfamily)